MQPRYIVRPDPEGFSVCYLWTGQPAGIALYPQTGLSRDGAEHTAQILNTRARQGDRVISQ